MLADPLLAPHVARLGRDRVKVTVVEALAACRAGDLAPDAVVPAVLAALPEAATSLRAVVNATGVVVHTNLGRAPLSAAAVDALVLAAGATDVELDLATGRRGRRGAGALEALARAVPDARGVHVVGNGAAALALATRGLLDGVGGARRGGADGGPGRADEVVVARGEMVEIGDGFRLPDLLESVGARLREVGTTNRVRREDYAAAVGPRTAFVLKVHPSNFRVEGFTSSVPVADLATLGVPVVADIGSGLLAPHPRLPDEPDAATTLRAGATVVTASGDKLLGGPQAGLLLGDADVVAGLRRHPLARALRVDKLTLAALEATLTGPTPPVPAALDADAGALLRRARAVAAQVGHPAEAVASRAAVGGGGAPGVTFASAAVAVPAGLAVALRRGRPGTHPPVLGHLTAGRLLLDLVAVAPEQDDVLAAAVRAALAHDAGEA